MAETPAQTPPTTPPARQRSVALKEASDQANIERDANQDFERTDTLTTITLQFPGYARAYYTDTPEKKAAAKELLRAIRDLTKNKILTLLSEAAETDKV